MRGWSRPVPIFAVLLCGFVIRALTPAGYAVVNGLLTWNASSHLRLELQVSNLLDRTYQAHLAGINRVRDVDIPVGERIYGTERTVTAGIVLTF